MKTKALTVIGNPHGAESTLEIVDLRADVALDREALMELGKLRENFTIAKLMNVRMIARMAKFKREKTYLRMGYPSFEACVKDVTGQSVDTIDRHIKVLESLPLEASEVAEIISFSASQYGRVNPVVADGHIFIGAKKFVLSRDNACIVQQAFDECDRELKRHAAEAETAKADLTKVRAERDNARKAVDKAREDLRKVLSSNTLTDIQDEDHKRLLNVEINVGAALLPLAGMRGRELSEDNQRRYVQVARSLYYEFLRVLDDGLTRFPSPFDPHEGWMNADISALEQTPPRKLLEDYLDKKGLKK